MLDYDYTLQIDTDCMDFRTTWKVKCDYTLGKFLERIFLSSLLNEISDVTIEHKLTYEYQIIVKTMSTTDYTIYIESLIEDSIRDLKHLELCYSLPVYEKTQNTNREGDDNK